MLASGIVFVTEMRLTPNQGRDSACLCCPHRAAIACCLFATVALVAGSLLSESHHSVQTYAIQLISTLQHELTSLFTMYTAVGALRLVATGKLQAERPDGHNTL